MSNEDYIKIIIKKSKKENPKFHKKVKKYNGFWFLEPYYDKVIIKNMNEGSILKTNLNDIDSEYYYLIGNYINNFDYAVLLCNMVNELKSKVDKVIKEYLEHNAKL